MRPAVLAPPTTEECYKACVTLEWSQSQEIPYRSSGLEVRRPMDALQEVHLTFLYGKVFFGYVHVFCGERKALLRRSSRMNGPATLKPSKMKRPWCHGEWQQMGGAKAEPRSPHSCPRVFSSFVYANDMVGPRTLNPAAQKGGQTAFTALLNFVFCRPQCSMVVKYS